MPNHNYNVEASVIVVHADSRRGGSGCQRTVCGRRSHAAHAECVQHGQRVRRWAQIPPAIAQRAAHAQRHALAQRTARSTHCGRMAGNP